MEIAEKAHDMAVEAKQGVAKLDQKQDSHEDLCGLRYEGIKETMERIETSIERNDQKVDKHLDRLYGQRWKTAIWVIIFCIGMIGSMASYIWLQNDNRMENIENHHNGGS